MPQLKIETDMVYNLKDLSQQDTNALVQQIQQLYEQFQLQYPKYVDMFKQPVSVMDVDIGGLGHVSVTDRHAVQIKSIIGHCREFGLFDSVQTGQIEYEADFANLSTAHVQNIQDKIKSTNFTSIIEAGSGTGELSAFASRLFAHDNHFKEIEHLNLMLKRERRADNVVQVPATQTIFLLVERETGFKTKYDYLLRNNGDVVFRQIVDLRDYVFCGQWARQKLVDNLEQFKNDGNAGETQTIMTGHNDQIHNVQHNPEEEDQQNIIVIGKHVCGGATDVALSYAQKFGVKNFGIALCCHGKSDGTSYINQKLFGDLQITQKQLCLIHRASSWQFAFKGKAERDNLSQVGLQARIILDVGRALWLEQNGFCVEFRRYCEETDSPEQWLLLATKK